MARLEEASSPQVGGEQIHFLCREIARCAVKHQAALQMSFLEGRTKRSDSQEQGNRPSGVETAMLRLLREGRRTGFIRPDVDLAVVADRVCQSVLHAGLAVVRHGAPTDDVAEVFVRNSPTRTYRGRSHQRSSRSIPPCARCGGCRRQVLGRRERSRR